MAGGKTDESGSKPTITAIPLTQTQVPDKNIPLTSSSSTTKPQTTHATIANDGTLFGVIAGGLQILTDVATYWGKQLSRKLLSQQDPQTYYKHLMSVATNYEQWAAAGLALDRLQGKEKWKLEAASPDYDYELLQDRLAQLKIARETGDLGSMIFILRTSLSRNLGDMGNPKLFGVLSVGTKKLIEDYVDEVIQQLNIICDTDSPDLDNVAKYDFFTNTQRSFGRTALLLSGGAVFGLSHIGVVKTLYETKLLPRIVNGSSVGSIAAAIICTRTDEELPAAFDPNLLDMDFFERPSVVFDVEVFIDAMRKNIGDLTFQEAFNRTRRVLNIGVSSSTVFEMPRLLNYLTAPNVVIWSAVAASCAIPFVYRSAPLMAKDKTGKILPWNPSGHRWIDGSVENDLPMQRISELFNVNHFIVCQVNPHVMPFMQTKPNSSLFTTIVSRGSYLIRSEILHRLGQLADLGLGGSFLYRIRAILVQKYYGDITIVPAIPLTEYPHIVSNPDVEMCTAYTLIGERATWPQVSIIKNHLEIELAIDEILYRLRVRKLDEHSQIQKQGQQGQHGQHINGVDKVNSRRPMRPGFGLTQLESGPGTGPGEAKKIAQRTPSM
ncbi:hypothetical protein HDU76_012033 [Blyttiomyces sp. JEL0837]|nr:hypothetical protein HDU76_012033 [Blyttiomyces sp. JEL0837]